MRQCEAELPFSPSPPAETILSMLACASTEQNGNVVWAYAAVPIQSSDMTTNRNEDVPAYGSNLSAGSLSTQQMQKKFMVLIVLWSSLLAWCRDAVHLGFLLRSEEARKPI